MHIYIIFYSDIIDYLPLDGLEHENCLQNYFDVLVIRCEVNINDKWEKKRHANVNDVLASFISYHL